MRATPRLVIVDQRAGELLVAREVGANETHDIIDVAAHLPALDDLVDRGKPLLETAAIGVLFQDDLGEDVDRPRQLPKLDHGLIAGDDAGRFQPADPLERGTRRQSYRFGELLDGRTSVALQRRRKS